MTRIALPAPNRSRSWFVVLGIAVLIGAYLRLDQIAMQVLIDDEWHAVHQFITRTPREMFFDFGYADYSIPLGILDWYQAQAWGVSELTLRWPMLACGLATLVLMPLYVAPRLGRRTAAVFALLIALSPLLVIFTRMARPYAITLLLGWVAHAAYQRYQSTEYANERRQWAAGATYVVATVARDMAASCHWALCLRTAAMGIGKNFPDFAHRTRRRLSAMACPLPCNRHADRRRRIAATTGTSHGARRQGRHRRA